MKNTKTTTKKKTTRATRRTNRDKLSDILRDADEGSAVNPELRAATAAELYEVRRVLAILGHMVRDSVHDGRPSAVWDRQDQANGHAMALDMRLMLRRLGQTLSGRTTPTKEAA